MALQQIKFAPGIDRQDTSVGAVGRWTDSDLTRFRYGLPEKIGGWQSLLTDTIVGVVRKEFAFVDLYVNRYEALKQFIVSLFDNNDIVVKPTDFVYCEFEGMQTDNF